MVNSQNRILKIKENIISLFFVLFVFWINAVRFNYFASRSVLVHDSWIMAWNDSICVRFGPQVSNQWCWSHFATVVNGVNKPISRPWFGISSWHWTRLRRPDFKTISHSWWLNSKTARTCFPGSFCWMICLFDPSSLIIIHLRAVWVLSCRWDSPLKLDKDRPDEVLKSNTIKNKIIILIEVQNRQRLYTQGVRIGLAENFH